MTDGILADGASPFNRPAYGQAALVPSAAMLEEPLPGLGPVVFSHSDHPRCRDCHQQCQSRLHDSGLTIFRCINPECRLSK